MTSNRSIDCSTGALILALIDICSTHITKLTSMADKSHVTENKHVISHFVDILSFMSLSKP